MSDDVLCAVERVQERGYIPAPLDAIGDELGWSGSVAELEGQLDQLVAEDRLKRQQLKARDPEYWVASISGRVLTEVRRHEPVGASDYSADATRGT